MRGADPEIYLQQTQPLNLKIKIKKFILVIRNPHFHSSCLDDFLLLFKNVLFPFRKYNYIRHCIMQKGRYFPAFLFKPFYWEQNKTKFS